MPEDYSELLNGSSSKFTPIHSEEAECGVLGCIIIDPLPSLHSCYDANVTPSDFWDKTHAKIFEICRDMDQAGEDICFDTVFQKAKDLGLQSKITPILLGNITERIHSTAHFPTFLKDLKERSNARRLLAACNAIKEDLPTYPQTVQEQAAKLRTLIDQIETASYWEDPKTIQGDAPARRFIPVQMLPEPLAAWVADTAIRMQCPIDYPAVAIVTALSGAVMRRIGIRPKANDNWTVVPNLWALIVGRPSAMKSPPVSAALSFLKDIESEWHERHLEDLHSYNIEERAFSHAEKSFEKRIRKAWDDGNRELAIQLSAELEEQRPKKPIQKRILIGDSTHQKVALMMEGNPHGLLMQKDELRGWMMEMMSDRNAEARSFWISAWSGDQAVYVDRIGRDSNRVDGAAVSVIGNIQPGPLAAIVKAGSRDDGDDGFLSRFQLTVIPEDYCERQWIDQRPDVAIERRVKKIFHDLAHSDGVSLGGMETDNGIPFVRFKDDAQGRFKETWEYIHEVAKKENPQLESILIKYGSMIPSLALLFSLADGKRGSVGLEYLEMAILWARYLLSHARKIFGSETKLQKAAVSLALKIKSGDLHHGMTVREIRRACWAGLNDDDLISRALTELEDLNWIRRTTASTRGRPSVRILVNPKFRNQL